MALSATASTSINPHLALQERRRNEALAACIEELPEVYQSTLRLYYWLGAGVSEIGGLLEIPENTVKSYLHRSRQLLLAMLRERGVEDV